MEASSEKQRDALVDDIEELLRGASDARKRFADMRETLVNYKREARRDRRRPRNRGVPLPRPRLTLGTEPHASLDHWTCCGDAFL